MKPNVDYKNSDHSDQRIFVIVRQGGWTAVAVVKGTPKGTIWIGATQVARRGRLDCESSGQKTLKESLKLKKDCKARAYSSQMVLLVVRQGCWTA
jgi:hypothetical protein